MIDERSSSVVIGAFDVSNLRVSFNVEKLLASKPNVASVTVYNLDRERRQSLEDLAAGFQVGTVKISPKPVPVRIEAGYRDAGISQIFLGQLRTVVSSREGSDYLTTVTSGDGEREIQTGFVSESVGPGAPVDTAIRAMTRALGVPNADAEARKIATLVKARGKATMFSQGVTLTGNAAQWLTDFCRSADLEWSIQDGQLQILDRGKALRDEVYQLSASSGLIGSPSVDQEGVCTFEARMLPDMRPGRVVVLDSEFVRGNYKIQKSNWIGDTHGAEWKVACEAVRY